MHNEITIIGNLGGAPEMTYLPSGTAVTRFNVATNRRWRTQDGQTQEHTEWYRVSAFGRLAETTNEYLDRGRLVHVIGEHRTSPWQTESGELRSGNEVSARKVTFLGGGDSSAGASGGAPAGEDEDVPW